MMQHIAKDAGMPDQHALHADEPGKTRKHYHWYTFLGVFLRAACHNLARWSYGHKTNEVQHSQTNVYIISSVAD
jgi:hypothetical protein